MAFNKEIEQKICELQGKLRDYVINNKKAPENTLVNGIIAICTRFAREIAESADIYKSIAVTSEEIREKEKYEIENKAKLEVLKANYDADKKITEVQRKNAMLELKYKDAEAQGVKKVKKEISERNSKNAKSKANTPEKIKARKKIFEMAKSICETSKTKLTINAIATKISHKLLLDGNQEDYGINAENPKNTIYSWLKKYPNEWKQ